MILLILFYVKKYPGKLTPIKIKVAFSSLLAKACTVKYTNFPLVTE